MKDSTGGLPVLQLPAPQRAAVRRPAIRDVSLFRETPTRQRNCGGTGKVDRFSLFVWLPAWYSNGMDLCCPIMEFKEKRVTVMGLGRFGGGAGAVRFLADRGARVTVTDLQSEEELADSLVQLDGLPLEAVHLGGHVEHDFLHTDLVVANPAVPRRNKFLETASRAGIPITSEMNLFWLFNRGQVIGVTGSNGKSTTAGLVHSILKSADVKCRLGGNIGTSLLPDVDDIEPDEWVVLELSSFQLDDLDRLPSSPHVAVVTNFSPNHIDWHGSLAEYRRAKQSIVRWQTPDCAAVLNQDDPDVAGWPTFGRCYWFGETDLGREGIFADGDDFVLRYSDVTAEFPLARWLKLPGRHNVQNAMAAVCAALAAGVRPSDVQAGLEAFCPLPHRLEFVAEVAGRTFFNDSLATTPESTIAALDAFDAPVVLLAGGYDKQIDLTLMAECISRRAKAVALMGQTAEHLESLIEFCSDENAATARVCESFDDAFGWACQQANSGDVVLLSPGCASYDWFRDFRQRGDRFTELVRESGKHRT